MARVGFASPVHGPNTLYLELLKALAHQRGLSLDVQREQLGGRGYRLRDVYFPLESLSGGPSPIKASSATEVDFSLPVRIVWRSAGSESDGTDYGRIPEESLLETTRARIIFESGGGTRNSPYLIAMYSSQGQLTLFKYGLHGVGVLDQDFPQRLSMDLFVFLELLSQMRAGYFENRARVLFAIEESLAEDTWGQSSFLDPQHFAPRILRDPSTYGGSLISVLPPFGPSTPQGEGTPTAPP
jgi:hypothetical protein